MNKDAAVSFHADAENHFLLTVFSGALTDEALYRHFEAVEGVSSQLSPYRELVHGLGVDDVSGISVRALVQLARRSDHGECVRLAILMKESPLFFGLARAFQTVASSPRSQVKLFHDRDMAMHWLAKDERDLTHLDVFCSSAGL